jgi:hypothetical protein
MADVILTKIGCLVIQGKTCNEIELIDVYSRRTIFKEQMASLNDEVVGEDFVYKDLRPAVMLPTGFTGVIISRYEDTILCSDHSFDREQSGLILFLKVKSETVCISLAII